MTWFENFYSRIKNTTGAIEADKDQFTRAFAQFDEAIRLNPKNPEAFFNRGVAFGQTGQCDRALEDLNEAIRLNPNDPDYFTNRGSAHYRTGESNKAIADYNEAIRLNPEHTIALTLRARVMATEHSEPTQASRTSSQTQSTSVPATTQASDKPPRIPDVEMWQTYLTYDPIVKETVERLSSLSAKNVEEFRTLLLRHRDTGRAKEFEDEAIRRVQGSAFVDDTNLRETYISPNREHHRLGDELVRVVSVIGKPKDLDRIIALIRQNNKNPFNPDDKVARY
jgi:tetratricopeptide (TPR) repeat protein